MTLMLETESHGEVEAGFYSVFTQFARLGEYTFSTMHLCELVKHLAENPGVRESRILGFDLDTFWQNEDRYVGGLAQIIAEAEQSCLPGLAGEYRDKRWIEMQGGLNPNEEANLFYTGKPVPVVVAEDRKSITIGQYRISALHFGRMAAYVAGGGFMGWVNGKVPPFAQSALQAMKESDSPLYLEVRNDFSSAGDKN